MTFFFFTFYHSDIKYHVSVLVLDSLKMACRNLKQDFPSFHVHLLVIIIIGKNNARSM